MCNLKCTGEFEKHRKFHSTTTEDGFSGKTVVPFCTSGGSGTGKMDAVMHGVCKGNVNWKPAKLVNGFDAGKMKAWVESL